MDQKTEHLVDHGQQFLWYTAIKSRGRYWQMFPVEVDYFARRERCKDFIREAAMERLAQECRLGCDEPQEAPGTFSKWVSSQAAKLGLRSYHF